MEIIKPSSYLYALVTSSIVNRDDTLVVRISDLLELKRDCEYMGNFKQHPEYLNVEDACRRLDIAKITLYGWLKSGKIHGIKKGRKWLIPEIDLL